MRSIACCASVNVSVFMFCVVYSKFFQPNKFQQHKTPACRDNAMLKANQASKHPTIRQLFYMEQLFGVWECHVFVIAYNYYWYIIYIKSRQAHIGCLTDLKRKLQLTKRKKILQITTYRYSYYFNWKISERPKTLIIWQRDEGVSSILMPLSDVYCKILWQFIKRT